MTTVVANLEQMACDSMISGGMVDFPSLKVHRIRKSLVGCAGDMPAISLFLDWFQGTVAQRRKMPVPPHHMDDLGDFEILELNDTGLWLWCNSFFPIPVDRGAHAIGAGAQAAMAALICGKTPAEAAEIAVAIMPSACALPIQVFDLVVPRGTRRGR